MIFTDLSLQPYISKIVRYNFNQKQNINKKIKMVKKAQQVKVSKSTTSKASKAAASKAPISKPQKPDRSVAQKLKQRSGPKWDLAKLA